MQLSSLFPQDCFPFKRKTFADAFALVLDSSSYFCFLCFWREVECVLAAIRRIFQQRKQTALYSVWTKEQLLGSSYSRLFEVGRARSFARAQFRPFRSTASVTPYFSRLPTFLLFFDDALGGAITISSPL